MNCFKDSLRDRPPGREGAGREDEEHAVKYCLLDLTRLLHS